MSTFVKGVEIPGTPITITVPNVHCALPLGLYALYKYGMLEDSRNGSVLVAPIPITTFYTKPYQRVVFWQERDANPYFHFFESLWMLAGREDVAYPASFAKQIAQYSDDNETLTGAYGHRWRHFFGFDQLDWIIKRFKENPNDRRVVLTMWSGEDDPVFADNGCKDIPCNTQVYFRINVNEEGLPELCMQVNCRSNDIIWGAYGANAVHMSMLQEYLADRIGVGVGWYAQASFNYHGYVDFINKMKSREKPEETYLSLIKTAKFMCETDGRCEVYDPYDDAKHVESPWVTHQPIAAKDQSWDEDLFAFLESPGNTFKNSFFYNVALPMHYSYQSYRQGHYEQAIENIGRCTAYDWRRACTEWLERRAKK
jgi:thymidylate synthase